MLPNFPKKVYGRCPRGHNPEPSGATGDDLSTNEISEGEEQPLYWSNYYQQYVCAMCLREVDDKILNDVRHDKIVEAEKTLSDIGYKRQSS